MRIPHTSTNPGKRVRIVLKDGTRIDDRFVTRTDRWIVLKNTGRIMKRDIQSFIVLKGATDAAADADKPG